MIELHHISENVGSVLHSQNDISCFIDDVQIGSGTLDITTSEISWKNGSGEGFKINYHWINVVALSKDTSSSFPQPCVYLMTENISCAYRKPVKSDGVNGNTSHHDSDGGDDSCHDSEGGNECAPAQEEEKDIIEIKMVPADMESLTPIYQAINQGNHFNPSDVSEDEDYDDFEPDYEEGQGDHENIGDALEQEAEEQGYSGGDQGQFDNADGEEDMES